ncbi:MAG: hypothetical protein KJZ86_16725 [Caldilineaceae bacterium]|nr:hypothetical protein [Caldilineaceae bacterium]
MHRPPYFDWRLDRWKIGFALLFWLVLLLFAPGQPGSVDPQGASPLARPGQRPVVGSSSRSAPTLVPAGAVALPAQTAQAEAAKTTGEANPDRQASPAEERLSLAILGEGRAPLGNSTPLFYGETEADGLMEVLLEGRRYAVVADSRGYWQFAPTSPLPVGMTWVQARLVTVDGVLLSGPVSVMALISPAGQPVAAPGILTPLSSAEAQQDNTPLFSGIGSAGVELLFYGKGADENAPRLLGKSVVGDDGGWQWQMSRPLPPGENLLWAETAGPSGEALSRSWPVRLLIAADAQPSVPAETPLSGVDATR